MTGKGREAPRILVTMGDPAGVGPEVLLRALTSGDAVRNSDVSIVGSSSAVATWARLLSLDVPCDVVDVGDAPVEPGCPTPEGAAAALTSIETAARMCLNGEADAMVTAPVSKSAVADLGTAFVGHSEFLADLTRAADFVMTFVHGRSRIGLATTHVALSDVSGVLTVSLLVSKLRTLSEGLKTLFGTDRPRIAVTALNPHAGEGGAFGAEEAAVIGPAIEKAGALGIVAEGPFPADALFARAPFGGGAGEGPGSSAAGVFDAVLVMYHDQGTIPAKLMAGGASVNLTLGLPIVRTSVDHGTAFDVAGKAAADATSMTAAIELAREIVSRAR